MSDGALCVFPPGFTNREGEPLPLIVRKQDGGYGYAATDLAALRYRTQTLGATRLLYVVGAPQAQHLAMVFAVGAQAGWLAPPARAEHVAFGSILGADKKMFKTRAGETVRLTELLDEAVERAAAELEKRRPRRATRPRARELAPRSASARSSTPTSRTIASRTTSSTGTACSRSKATRRPYLQYAHARIHSIFRKARGGGVARRPRPRSCSREPRRARARARAARLRQRACRSRRDAAAAPALRGYLFDLATAFTAFYETCPVLKAPDGSDARRRASRSASSRRACSRAGFVCWAIAAPERM